MHAYGGLSVCDTKSKKIAVFNTRKESLQSYVLSLNRNKAYQEFRKKRAQLLQENKRVTGVELAPYLTKYSTRGKDYTDEVKKYINHLKLDSIIYDALHLASHCQFTDPED